MTPLGAQLFAIRKQQGRTLRDVEAATNGRISNAYLSQLETGKVKHPGPEILFTLAEAYGTPYEELMELAGYLSARGSKENRPFPTNNLGILSPEEERQLITYLAFIRITRKP